MVRCLIRPTKELLTLLQKSGCWITSKVMMNIHKYGNTTSATLPLLLADYENQLKKGDNIIFAAFGGGFTWGAIYT